MSPLHIPILQSLLVMMLMQQHTVGTHSASQQKFLWFYPASSHITSWALLVFRRGKRGHVGVTPLVFNNHADNKALVGKTTKDDHQLIHCWSDIKPTIIPIQPMFLHPPLAGCDTVNFQSWFEFSFPSPKLIALQRQKNPVCSTNYP